MAMKTPATGRMDSSPVRLFLSRTASTLASPRISATSVLKRTGMPDCRRVTRSRSWARRLSRRCTMVTSTPMLCRCRASVTALSPPPTMSTFFPVKSGPSQVEQ